MTSYAQVSQQEGSINAAAVASLSTRLETDDFGDGTLRTSTYSSVEEARHLTWRDSYYDGKHGIVAAFDRDSESAGTWFMWTFLRTAIFFWMFSVTYWILGVMDMKYSEEASIVDDICGFYMLLLGGIFAVLGARARQAMLTQHVAITTEGVRIDNGSMVSMTIPFEHIQKCDVAPYKLCFQQANFFTVTLRRSAAPLEQFFCTKTRKLEIYGIIRAQEFSDLIMAMKDSQDNGTYEGANTSRVELQQIA